MWISFLNFERGPRAPLLSFEGGSQGPEVAGPGVLVPLLHHANLKVYLKNIYCKLQIKTCLIC